VKTCPRAFNPALTVIDDSLARSAALNGHSALIVSSWDPIPDVLIENRPDCHAPKAKLLSFDPRL